LIPSRRSHREKFEEISNKILDNISLEVIIDSIEHTKLSRTILEQINSDFTYILNIVTKKIKGLQRVVPFSK